MSRAIRGAMAAAVLLGMALAAPSPAAESEREFLRFLHGLQQKGYGDVALDYLDQLEKRADLPTKIREILDLERCNSLRSAAQTAYDARVGQQYLADAQKYLDKFLKEHPHHPQASAAMVSWGDNSLEQALQSLAAARTTGADKAKQEALLAAARTALTEAGGHFVEASKAFRTLLAELPPVRPQDRRPDGKPTAAQREREDVELGAIESRFKIVLVNYYLAQTYADPQDPNRKKILTQVSKQFDNIYQDYRNNVNQVCLYAHLWHGRTLEELGDAQTAIEILDEVLAGAPDTDAGDTASAPLYAQAALFRLRATMKQGKPEQYLPEAVRWLQLHKGWRDIAAYQGIALEVTKAQIAMAEKMAGPARTKQLHQVSVNLGNIAKVESEYQQEALLLRRQLLKDLGGANTSVEEFLALGDSALSAGQTAEAEENFTQALNLALEKKDEKGEASARQRLNRIRYTQALALYTSGKHAEALTAAGMIAREDASDPSAASAAALAMSAALALYTAAADKEAAMTRMERIADFLLKKWPDRPEADEARMALGQARLLKGEIDTAVTLFNQVNADSKRYPTAMYILGQIYWKTYLDEKKKDEPARRADRMNESRRKAQECLQNAVNLFRKDVTAEDKDSQPDEKNAGPDVSHAAQLAEAQLLLAEVLVEGKEYQQAIALVDPLLERLKASKRKSVDTPTFRTFMTSVRSHMALGETDKAAEIAVMLVELSEDNARVNGVLVNFAKLLGQELKRADAAVTEAQGGTRQTQDETRAKRDAIRQLLGKLLAALGARQEHALADMVYLGDTCAALGLADQARQQYQRVLDKAKEDEAFRKTAGKALVRVRAQLVGLLRMSGDFEAATKQADELIAKNPRALEPRMTKAQILEDWAAKDPSKYDAAVTQWTEIRLLLGHLPQKPPEYFEVIYKVACCLYAQYEKSKDPTKLLQCEQLLKSTLVLNSKLTGPDLVAQYNELLKKIATARAKAPKEVKPVKEVKPEAAP